MPTGVNLMRLPSLEYPGSAKLDFSPMERALRFHVEAGFRQSQLERDDARLALDRDRFGLETNRFGLETSRAGLERERFGEERRQFGLRHGLSESELGLRQAQDRRTEEDRRATLLANEAGRIHALTDEPQRADAWMRFLQRPGVGDTLRRGGQDPSNYRTGPQFLMGQAQDAQARELQRLQAEALTHGPRFTDQAPGHVGSIREPDPDRPGHFRYRPVTVVPPRGRDLSVGDVNTLTTQGTQFADIQRFYETWRPEFSRPGTFSGGDVRNWITRNLGSRDEDVRRMAQWWQDYQGNYELGRRNQMFGATLTPGELRLWEAAAITPNMDPGLIQANLQRQRELIMGAAERRVRSLVTAGYDSRAILEAYGLQPGTFGVGADRLGPRSGPPPGGGTVQPPGGGTIREVPTRRIGEQTREGARRQLNGAGPWYVYRNGRWETE